LFPSCINAIYLIHQKFWNKETQTFRSNIWPKKTCTVKFKVLLIFSVCSPHSKYVDTSPVRPFWYMMPIQICWETWNIFIQTFTSKLSLTKTPSACNILCSVTVLYPAWKYMALVIPSCCSYGRASWWYLLITGNYLKYCQIFLMSYYIFGYPYCIFMLPLEVLSCDESFALSAYILFVKITSSKIESELVSKLDIKY